MKIVLVTDTHLSPQETQLAENWSAVGSWLRGEAPDLAVHLGDITANGWRDASELTHARRLIDEAGQDFLFLPGNHDIGDNPAEDGSVAEEPFDATRLRQHRKAFGPDWWSFHAEAWQIIGLNTQLLGTGSADEAEQEAWLAETLRAADGPLGVMTHKPLCPPEHAIRAPGRYPPRHARQALMARLNERDLRFVAAGHTHQALSWAQNGTQHIWVPSTAFCIPDAMQEPIGEKCVGAMRLTLDAGGHSFERAAPPGLTRYNLLHLDEIYPQVAALRLRLGPDAALR